MKNISFHHFFNDGYVKIKLRPGQKINWNQSSWNGEDRSWRAESFEYDADEKRLVYDYSYGGRDCDGVSRAGGTMFADLGKLKEIPAYSYPGILKPDWKEEDEWNRDYSAEAANY